MADQIPLIGNVITIGKFKIPAPFIAIGAGLALFLFAKVTRGKGGETKTTTEGGETTYTASIGQQLSDLAAELSKTFTGQIEETKSGFEARLTELQSGFTTQQGAIETRITALESSWNTRYAESQAAQEKSQGEFRASVTEEAKGTAAKVDALQKQVDAQAKQEAETRLTVTRLWRIFRYYVATGNKLASGFLKPSSLVGAEKFPSFAAAQALASDFYAWD